MLYAIMRHGKIKAPLMGAAIAHNYRTTVLEKENIVAELTPLNNQLFRTGSPHQRLAEKLQGKKKRKDAVVAIEIVLSASPEFFDAIETDRKKLYAHPKFREWVKKTLEWVRKEFGQNLFDLSLHMDESSPHIHAMVVPLTADGRLCAKEVMSKAEMIRRQTDYAEALGDMGLNRGISASKSHRKHVPLGGGKDAAQLEEQLDLAKRQIIDLGEQLEASRQETQAALKRAENAERELAFEKQTTLDMARFKAERIEAAKRKKPEPTSGPSFER